VFSCVFPAYNQLKATVIDLEIVEKSEGIGTSARTTSESTRTSYKRYGALFRNLTRKSLVEELIEPARKADFASWLQKTARNDV
jgi:hypothetical protein